MNGTMYWSVRRELWENRSVYLAPLIVAGIVLFATMLTTMGLSYKMRNPSPANPAKPRSSVAAPLKMAPAPIMFVSLIVGFVYSLDALYGERRERSILFWKSLPVSDLTTVLSKVAIPLMVLPLIAYALSVVTQVILLFVGSGVLMGSGASPAGFWADARFFEGLIIMFYGLAVHVIWFAPLHAWLLLVSGWARRVPFLWAVVPPVTIGMIERMMFGTRYVGAFIQYRFAGAMTEAFVKSPGRQVGDVDRLSQLDPVRFFSAPGLWLGLLFSAAFIFAAVRLRRRREPI